MAVQVQFGDFVLDLDSRELRRGEEPLKLSPKALQLLEILATNRPKALSKAELQRPAVAGDIRRREEPGESRQGDSRDARRQPVRPAVHPNRPAIWLRLPRAAANSSASSAGGGDEAAIGRLPSVRGCAVSLR